MPDVRRLDLSLQTKQAWSHLTFPRFRVCLEGKDFQDLEDVRIVAIGAEQTLAIASCQPDLSLVEVHSIFSEGSPETLLSVLDLLEQEVVREGCTTLMLDLPETQHNYSQIKDCLQKRGWGGPRPFIEKYFFDIYTFSPPWFKTPPSMIAGFEEFPWRKLRPKEREMLLHQVEQERIPVEVSPFGDEEKDICYKVSKGLRYKGEVVGWCVTHKMSHDMLRFTTLYIHNEKKRLGPSIRLLINTIKQQQRSPYRWTVFELNLKQTDESWKKFVRRRLAPYAIGITCWQEFWKILK